MGLARRRASRGTTKHGPTVLPPSGVWGGQRLNGVTVPSSVGMRMGITKWLENAHLVQ